MISPWPLSKHLQLHLNPVSCLLKCLQLMLECYQMFFLFLLEFSTPIASSSTSPVSFAGSWEGVKEKVPRMKPLLINIPHKLY